MHQHHKGNLYSLGATDLWQKTKVMATKNITYVGNWEGVQEVLQVRPWAVAHTTNVMVYGRVPSTFAEC